RPPIIEPIAIVKLDFTLIFTSDFAEVLSDTQAIANTVDADDTAIESASEAPKKSRTRLIMIPPPNPALEPHIVAIQQAQQQIITTISSPFPTQLRLSSLY